MKMMYQATRPPGQDRNYSFLNSCNTSIWIVYCVPSTILMVNYSIWLLMEPLVVWYRSHKQSNLYGYWTFRFSCKYMSFECILSPSKVCQVELGLSMTNTFKWICSQLLSYFSNISFLINYLFLLTCFCVCCELFIMENLRNVPN